MTKYKLSTAKEIRKALASVANGVLSDTIDTKKANAFVYVTNAILQSIRIDDQEKEIQELRELIQQIQKYLKLSMQ